MGKEMQIPKFPPEIYVRIALNNLVTYSVYFLSHPFAKALKEAVEKKLEPLVEEERKRAQAEQSTKNE